MSYEEPLAVEITVGKGLTVELGNCRWQKSYFQLTTTITAKNEADLDAWKKKMEAKIDAWLPKPGPASDHKVSERPPAIAQLDIAEVEDLPWKNRAKQRVSGGWAWIKSEPGMHDGHNVKVVHDLCEAILKDPMRAVRLGAFDYKFAGDKNQFLNRYPVKEDSAK